MNSSIHQTKDGSSTVYSESFNQYYHNPNGAASESLHVFFEQPGVFSFLKEAPTLTILEVGFGTGLNFLLLLDYLKEHDLQVPVRFFSIEAFPVDAETAKEFDFTGHLKKPHLNTILPDIFRDLQPGMNSFKPVDELDVELIVFQGKFEDFSSEDVEADFIFHDPFSPGVNGELWTDEAFKKLASFSQKDTMLTTYCAASGARAAMAVAGWKVARARGALGKREMTLASRNAEKLEGFKRVNEERLIHRYKEGDFS
ncbi:tRNA (5-methylaminomethyl-2-thiouridine)(34)-methyltransferase MnmD [Gracilimonas mengyeensis]|uniref:tRNA U34 5-methylaminomethyl-2-thiouridine-forming methyltransferase MnmC n=1 Tax=Gracilimonas mengyeensis TaxID=1302730 RepID=A0A521FK29_9BACT|nr:tRNA (5-methylaminomethyl-2-thiouridine)(34)-methyltransferase MnmD [Gracilimonas mengyeensis]SMO96577.1 tRNA U34 5-methylaminomethyl-2-thiouridine-forming methyltransferase MnmC [Gracilimonas mengyeensis]